MGKKLAELRWWSLVAAVLMSGLAIYRLSYGGGHHGDTEAVLAVLLWACVIWGFAVHIRNPPNPDDPTPGWNPVIISTHGEGSFNRTLIISGLGVVVGIVLLAFKSAIGVPVIIGAVIVPVATWRNSRRPR